MVILMHCLTGIVNNTMYYWEGGTNTLYTHFFYNKFYIKTITELYIFFFSYHTWNHYSLSSYLLVECELTDRQTNWEQTLSAPRVPGESTDRRRSSPSMAVRGSAANDFFCMSSIFCLFEYRGNPIVSGATRTDVGQCEIFLFNVQSFRCVHLIFISVSDLLY